MKRAAEVWTGIDVLERDGFRALQGSRIGLITNRTGRNRQGRATIDLLHAAPGVRLQALFGPEHGLRGEFDEAVADERDPQTGLPIFSLYGTREKPTAEQVEDLDTLVFDIQDIGCRFYTYISTLRRVMEVAGEFGKRIVVLDRPNPITGHHLEGPLADPEHLAFVAPFPMPVRHGMTAGELARLFDSKNKMRCSLEVIACEGWERSDWFDATGLLWTNPSPNMRSLAQATLYPGIGLLEMTNISVGRGTDTPFEVIGAPFVQARDLAAALRQAELPGVTFIPVEFQPAGSTHQEVRCEGVRLLVTDRDSFNAVRLGVTLAVLLRSMYPESFTANKFWNLLVNQSVYNLFMAGTPAEKLERYWQADLQGFEILRSSFLLYA